MCGRLLVAQEKSESFTHLQEKALVVGDADRQVLNRQRHDHASHFGCEVSLLARRSNHLACRERLIQEVLHVVVNERAELLLLHGVVTSLVLGTRDHSLEPDRVGLIEHLGLTFVARKLRLARLFAFFWHLRWKGSCLILARLGSLTLFTFLNDIALHFCDGAEDSEKQLTLLSLQIFLDTVDHVSCLLLVLEL